MSYQSVVELKSLAQRKPTKFTVGDVDRVRIREGERVQALQAKCPHVRAGRHIGWHQVRRLRT